MKKDCKIEILLSCLNADFHILDKNKYLNTDVLIVNQCDENGYEEKTNDKYLCRMIKTKNRGLSLSRNELLLNMNGDIGVICDDDVVYNVKYEEIIRKAFKEFNEADIIVFNVETKNNSYDSPTKRITEKRKSPRNKYYASVQIAFKKESLYKNNIFFDLNFGSGSTYSSGEESLLLCEARKKGLTIYEYPECIGTVDCSTSTWFKGYNKKFFFDKGAWLKAAYPYLYMIYKYYYILRFYKSTDLSIYKMLTSINNGVKGYKKNLSYEEFEIGAKK